MRVGLSYMGTVPAIPDATDFPKVLLSLTQEGTLHGRFGGGGWSNGASLTRPRSSHVGGMPCELM